MLSCVGDILNRNSFRQELLCLDQFISLLEDIPQVVHGMDIGRMQPENPRKLQLTQYIPINCHNSTSKQQIGLLMLVRRHT